MSVSTILSLLNNLKPDACIIGKKISILTALLLKIAWLEFKCAGIIIIREADRPE
jgi:hypothetical protein